MVLYIKKQNEIVKQEPNYFTKEIADGKKTTREQILEDLLFDYPELIPHAFADSDTCIPLVRQLTIPNHGTLDILATDNNGNIFILECKIVNKQVTDEKEKTNKTYYQPQNTGVIRGQITDYVAGLWAQYTTNNVFDKPKFEIFWDWVCLEIKKQRGKTIEEILPEQDVDDVGDIISEIKKNFEENYIICIFAVDGIPENLRNNVDWHNSIVNKEKNTCIFYFISKNLLSLLKFSSIGYRNFGYIVLNFDNMQLQFRIIKYLSSREIQKISF